MSVGSESCLSSESALGGNVDDEDGLAKVLAQVGEPTWRAPISAFWQPCNQFVGQEPGTSQEIAEFCSATYGATFPMTEKVDVNGDDRHPLYKNLVGTADTEGHTGDIR